jgi:hypothetical protein
MFGDIDRRAAIFTADRQPRRPTPEATVIVAPVEDDDAP